MSRRPGRLAVLGAIVIGVGWIGTAPALADHLEIEVQEPPPVTAGEVVELRVVVRSDVTNERIPDATVVAFRDVTFAGVTGRVKVSEATTNELGVAILRWEQRTSGEAEFVVEYTGPEESDPGAVTISVTAGAQVFRSTAGVQIPGLGHWVVIVLIAAVWSLLLIALARLVAVARVGSELEADEIAGLGGRD